MTAAARALLVALLCVAWVLPGTVGHEPWKPDEAYSFGLVQGVLGTGDWVVPRLAGEPFMEKPPFFYVVAAGFERIAVPRLPPHDAARLASALFLLLTFLFLGLAGRELWGKGSGWLAVIALLGSPGLVANSHLLVTDFSLLAGLAIGFYGLSLAGRRPSAGGFWLGAGTGIGFLSKGLLAPGILGLTALLAPLFFRDRRTREYARFLAVGGLTALPFLLIWPATLYLRSPELFREWLLVNNFGRFLGRNRLGPSFKPGFYLYILPYFAWPALPLAAWTFWRWARGKEGVREGARLPLLGFLVMEAVLGAAATTRQLYALPLLLPLCLLAPPAAQALSSRASERASRACAALFAVVAALAWVGWFSMQTGRPAALWKLLHGMHPGYVPSFRGDLFAAALSCTLLWLLLAARSPRSPGSPVVQWALGATLAKILVMTLWLPWMDAGMSYRETVVSLRGALPAGHGVIVSRGLGEPQRALLEYYAGIRTCRAEANGDCDGEFLLVQAPSAPGDPGPSWRKVWEGRRPGDDKEAFLLFRKAGDGARKQR